MQYNQERELRHVTLEPTADKENVDGNTGGPIFQDASSAFREYVRHFGAINSNDEKEEASMSVLGEITNSQSIQWPPKVHADVNEKPPSYAAKENFNFVLYTVDVSPSRDAVAEWAEAILYQEMGIETPDTNETTFKFQQILYRSLPNTCFSCHQRGHLVRQCPTRKLGRHAAKGREGKGPAEKGGNQPENVPVKNEIRPETEKKKPERESRRGDPVLSENPCSALEAEETEAEQNEEDSHDLQTEGQSKEDKQINQPMRIDEQANK
ncbi:hypothetical protein R1sor_018315 [Riccia sorocarpa]|uniref:CCHC-type domain-containing protein n=1 Tax=Riccia sorocarpa TaxID=122646 RepID=A0ABD3I9G6_9MARC